MPHYPVRPRPAAPRLRLAALAAVACLWAGSPLSAQPRKQATAERVPPGSITLDGRLDEEVWGRARPVTDFVQKEPVEGAAPTDPMEVRFVFDDEALYVGARMFAAPGSIQAPMGPRDEGQQAEHIFVSLDTHFDRRTAYTFGLTAAGVRLDRYHGSDDAEDFDEGFNPVWDGRAVIDEDGWTAEMWIPFTQLRFSGSGGRIWGLNVFRFVPTRNEEVYWALVPRTEPVWASRFGELHGIEGLPSTRRIELVPYAASASTFAALDDPADPFHSDHETTARAGLDLKMGIGPNLTLDATVNPDFGQVEADPAEVNLSAFETFFDERRPFFLEGATLLNGPVNNYFYSRRIGATPSGPADGDYVDYPDTNTILGAAKLTGRMPSGTSIGLLGAVTSRELARTFDLRTGRSSQLRVAPVTTYGVARVQQEFGPAASTAALFLTAVHRALSADDPLAGVLTRNALSIGGDSLLRFKGGEYELFTALGISYVQGEPQAIARLQRTSARYFQRPDVGYVTFDPTRTSLGGAKGVFEFSRVSGRHWLGSLSTSFETPEFETNDIGRLMTSDGITASGQLTYRETRPGRLFRNYSIGLQADREWNYGGDAQTGGWGVDGTVTWPNFWTTEVNTNFTPRAQDARLTRGGPSMATPRSWWSALEIESSPAARTRGSLRLEYGKDEGGGLSFEINGELAVQPAPRWRLSIEPGYDRAVLSQQYIQTLEGGGASTYGRRYVFAFVDRSTYSAQLRLRYTFKPDLDLELYAEPFAASGRYYDIGELAAARGRVLRTYGTDGTTALVQPDGSLLVTDGASEFVIPNEDFNVLSYRSNLVLRWEWRTGSTMYIVWQQDRERTGVSGRRVGVGDVFDSFSAPGNNFLAVKVSFWLPVE